MQPGDTASTTMADRDGERPLPPAWWEGSTYPTCEQFTGNGDPFHTFERIFDGNADRAWSLLHARGRHAHHSRCQAG